MESGRYS